LNFSKIFGFVVGRHFAGMLLSAISVVVIYKYIGPTDYGILLVSQSIWGLVFSISSLGFESLIISRRNEIDHEYISNLFNLHSLLNFIVFIIIFLILYFVSHSDPLLLFLLGLSGWFRNSAISLISYNEGILKYKITSIIELTSQIIYISALLLFIYLGFGVMAIVNATIISAFIFWLSLVIHVKPKFALNKRKFDLKTKHLFYDGIKIHFVNWVWQVKDYLIPQIIFYTFGPMLLGIYGMTNNLIIKMSFFRQLIWKINLAHFGKIESNDEQKKFSEKQTTILLLILSIIFCTSSFVINFFAQNDWSSAIYIFPALVFGILMNSIFSSTCAILLTKKAYRELMIFHTIHSVLYLVFLIVFSVLKMKSSFLLVELIGLTAYSYLFLVANNIGIAIPIKKFLISTSITTTTVVLIFFLTKYHLIPFIIFLIVTYFLFKKLILSNFNMLWKRIKN
jgi:O-antigen/teichoic acid export membrane protein